MARTGDPEGSPHTPAPSLGLRCLSEETPCPPNEAGRAETGQLAFSETTQTDGDMPPCTGGGRDALCDSGMRNHLEEGGTGCREQTGGVCSTPIVENSERSDCWEGRNGEKKTGELAGEKLMGGERPGGDREQAGLFRAGAKEAEDVEMEEQPRAPLTGGEGEALDVEGTSCSPSGCFTSPTGEPETLSPSVPSSLFGASAGDPGVSSTALGPTEGSQFSPSTLCSPPEKPDDDAGVEEGTDILPFFDATQATDPGRSPTDTNLDLTAASVSTSSEASFAPTSFSEFSAVASASTAPNGAFADACVPAASSFESSSAVSASLQSPESSPHSESPRQSSSPALAFPASHARPLSRAAARAGVNMSDALPPGLRPDILLHSPPEVVRQYVSEHFAYFQFSKKPETEILAGDKLQEEDSSEESEEEDEKAEGEKAIREKEEGEKQEGVDSKREEESRRVGGDDMGANAGFDGEKKRRGIDGSEEGEMEVATHADLSGTEFGEAAAVREEEKVSKRREMAMKAKQSARGHSIHRNEDKKKKRRKAEEEETPRLHPVNSLNLSCRRVKLYEVDEMGRWIDKGTGHFYVTEGRGTAAAGDGGGREDERSSLYLERGLERDDEAGEGQRDEDDETGMARLIVEDEENGKVYVDTAIGSNYAYQHQKDSIITWQEGRTGDVYRALSFQHPHGCFACWTYMTLKAPDRCAGGTEEEEEEEGDEGTLGAAEEEQRECGRRQGALGRFRRSTEEGVEDERDDEEEEDEAGVDSLVGLDGAESIPHHILETPNEDNLHMLMTRMEFDLPHPQTGELVLLDVLGRHWLYLLFAFMRKCIAAEKIEQLKQIAFIIRKMLVFWSGHIDALEVLLSDEFWPDVLKSLEYDQDLLHQGMEMRHSEFFAHKAQFHNVIQLEDPVFTSHVHLHYRLMYLKDVAITRYLDEAAINRLQSVLACNIQEVLRLLLRDCQSPPGCPSSPSSFSSYSSHSLVGVQSNESLSSSCFAVLRERLSEDFMAALFLRELLQNLSKLLQQQMLEKHSIFTQIKQHMILLELRGYLDGTSAAVANWNQVFLPLNKKAEEYQERLKEILLADGAETYRPNPLDLSGLPYPTPVCVAVEILNTFAELQPQLLRQAFFSEAKSDAKQESRLLLLLAETLEKSHSDSVQVQVKEILVKVVCSPVMELPEKDEIHMLFYDKGVMDRLLQTLFLPLNADEMTPSDFHRLHHAKQQILEILAHCVPAHKHRFKIRIQKDRVPIRAILASLRPTFDKFLALFAVKFIRACISLKDAYVDKHLVQHKVLRPIIWMLKEEQYAVSLFSSRRQQSSLLASVILDCLRALAAGAATFAAPQAPCHSLHLIEFLFTDDFCRHWIGDIQESMRTTGRRPCQTLQDLHDLYIQFVAKPSLCASQPLHLRSPQDYLSPSSRVLSPRSGGSGARDFFFSGSGLNSSDAGDGNLSPHSLRSSLGRVIRRDPNRSLDDEEEESWFLSDDKEDEDEDSPSEGSGCRENFSSLSLRNTDPDEDDEEEISGRRSLSRCTSSLVDGYDDDNEEDEDHASLPSLTSRKTNSASHSSYNRSQRPFEAREEDEDESFLLKAFPEKKQLISKPTRLRDPGEEGRTEKRRLDKSEGRRADDNSAKLAEAFENPRGPGTEKDEERSNRRLSPGRRVPDGDAKTSPKETSPTRVGTALAGPKKIAVKLKLGGNGAGTGTSSSNADLEKKVRNDKDDGDSMSDDRALTTTGDGRLHSDSDAESSGTDEGGKLREGEGGSELLAGMRLLSGVLKRKHSSGLASSLSSDSPLGGENERGARPCPRGGREGLLAARSLWGVGATETEDTHGSDRAEGEAKEPSKKTSRVEGGETGGERRHSSDDEAQSAGEELDKRDRKKSKWTEELVADMLQDGSDDEDA